MKSLKENAIFSWEKFEEMPIVGIVRGMRMEDFEQILPIYVKTGLTTIEITMNTPDVKSLIQYAIKEYSDNLNIGAGTVCNLSDLKNALDYGAQFIVTPIVNREIIKNCVDIKIPIFPGALTPTEIYYAWNSGASIVKIYPAGNLGASYIKDVMAPFNKIKMMPTGGININNIQSFLDVNVYGFGIGGQLFDKSLIDAKNWNALETHFSSYTQLLKNNYKQLQT
jgi:2-dehydro-3-deoxyphosphogluconate aldolase/(4S)-4-hydroxy-2-oxoglutarate aldolase